MPGPEPDQPDLIQVSKTHFLKIYFNISVESSSLSSKWLLSKILCSFIAAYIRIQCKVHLHLLDLSEENYISRLKTCKLRLDSRRGLGIFLFTTASRMALGPTQPPIQWLPGSLFLGVKRPGREADHSPPSSAEVKEWVKLTSTLRYTFMMWCSVS
jgi:hypothetical protein